MMKTHFEKFKMAANIKMAATVNKCIILNDFVSHILFKIDETLLQVICQPSSQNLLEYEYEKSKMAGISKMAANSNRICLNILLYNLRFTSLHANDLSQYLLLLIKAK